MGGKVAMLAALLHPAEVDRLVVVDIAPAPNPPTLLAYVRAMRAADLRGVTRRSEVDAQLIGAVPDAAERAFLLQNLLVGDGETRWRLNLEAIEREFPRIVGFPELPAGTAFHGPTLFVAGARSDYIHAEHEPVIRRLFPIAPGSSASKAPGIGFMPSSPGRFCRRRASFCPPPPSLSGTDGNRLAPVRPDLISNLN